jgi:YD repeat-containing protein
LVTGGSSGREPLPEFKTIVPCAGASLRTPTLRLGALIDANGNLTSDGTKTYFWNALNQLVEVKEGSTTIATFEYDGKGRRTEKAAGGITRTYIYDSEDIVEERVSGPPHYERRLPNGALEVSEPHSVTDWVVYNVRVSQAEKGNTDVEPALADAAALLRESLVKCSVILSSMPTPSAIRSPSCVSIR